MSLYDDTSDPRRDESLADDSVTAPIRPAELYTMAQGLPLLDALAPMPPMRYPLRLHKDPPLWRFGH